MTQQSLDTASVTVRIPNDLLKLIEEFGGKGKRSEVIITLLKKALDQPVPVFPIGTEKSKQLENLSESLELVRHQITQLDNNFNKIEGLGDQYLLIKQQVQSLSDSLELVRHQITQLDNNHEVKEISRIMESFELRLAAVENLKTSSDIPNEKAIEPLSRHIQLDISDDDLSKSTGELIEVEVIELFSDEEIGATESLSIFPISPLSGKYLSKRIGVNESTISAKKNQLTEQELYEWLASKDPDHINWRPLGETRRKSWIPVEDTPTDLLKKLQEWMENNPLL
jgi:hypothetical protein